MKTDNEQFSDVRLQPGQLLMLPEEWKLIREFMGYPMPSNYDGESKVLMDWNGIMPIVDKIEHTNEATIQIIRQYCRINKHNTPHFRYEKIESSKLEAVYKAVVEFIKWYNSVISPTG